ncbi:MAG TPA: hypothetical protein VFH70_11280, partial [Acidimicrobiales bacterium]|nr:hypothetical protein [Acidimicrobiales bacterium]
MTRLEVIVVRAVKGRGAASEVPETATEDLVSQVLVGRQPIFDRNLEVLGYELLFRSPDSLGHHDGDKMTANVLLGSALDIGLDNLVGSKLAFVNATRSFLVGEQEVPLPPT